MFFKSARHFAVISLILEAIGVVMVLCDYKNMCLQTDLYIIMISQLILQDGFFLIQAKLNTNTSIYPFSFLYNTFATVTCVIASLFLFIAVARTTHIIASVCGSFAAATHFGMAYEGATMTLPEDLSTMEKQNEKKE